MKSVKVFYNDKTELCTEVEDVSTPEYGPDDVLIKVSVASSNPKDWKHPLPVYFNNAYNQGDDCTGIISAVGSNVTTFRTGDRVAAFHVMDTPTGGTYAEYAVAPAHTTFRIPDSMSDEEGATLPLAAFTAAVGLGRNLGIGWGIERELEPLIINAASTAVGVYATMIAKTMGGISEIIAIAGASKKSSEEAGANTILDYRSPTIEEDIRRALGGKKAKLVFDASNSVDSLKYLIPNMDPQGRYTCTTGIGGGMYNAEQKTMLEKWGGYFKQMWVGSVHDDTPSGGRLFGAMVSRLFEALLREGKLKGMPYEVVPSGLNGVLNGLLKLRDRKGGNNKMVYRIADTESL